MTRIQGLLLRIGACVALVVLVVVPPVLVALLIGRPYPEWSTLTSEVEQGRVAADTVMRIAALLFVVIWIWLAITIASETFRLLRARAVDTPAAGRMSAPSIVRSRSTFVHRLVRIAVLGTVTTATTISTWPTAAIASTGASLAGSLDPRPPISAPADPTETAPTSAQTTTIVADGRATPLSIAIDLGDETLRDDIVAMNRTPNWTGGVFPAGTVVTIPVIEAPVAPQSTVPDGVYVVQPNDGLWNVAEAFLGDGSRHAELRSLLDGQEVAPGVVFDASTEVIHPGWTFQNPSAVAASAESASDVHVVQPGDTLSEISERHLGTADRWTELWNLNEGAVMPDGRTFDDPDLIVPGWRLALPSALAVDMDAAPEAGPAQTPPPPNDVGPPDVVDEETSPPAESTEPPVPSVPEPDVVDLPTPVSSPQINGLPAPSASPASVPATTAPAAPSSAVPSETKLVAGVFTDAERSVWPTVLAGSLLTAGLAALIARLRRRRLSQLQPGRRLPAPSNTAAGAEHALLTRSAATDLSTITALLRSITPYASTQGEPPAVRAVQLGVERIEVLFAKPAALPPKGWSTIDGGHSWTHRFDDPVEEHRQLLTPALVTIGVRTDEAADEVLLDLETAGSVAITGDRSCSLGLARSIVYELATYPLGVSMDVNLIGLDVPGVEHCDRTWTDTTIERAIRVAERRADRRLADGTTPIEERADLEEDDGSTDPQVFVVDAASIDDGAGVDQLVSLCEKSSGSAVVVLGDPPDVGERIIVNGDGTALWSGVDLVLPNVTDEAAEEIAELVEDLATAETELIEPDDLFASVLAAAEGPDEATTQDDETYAVEPYEPPPYDVLLRVMGEPRAEGVDLTADETELLALLVCLRHRTEIHIGLIHESVGPERARKTIENRMSILRRKLGAGSDGLDLLPEAAPGNHGRSQYLVSPLILTDIDLLEHRLQESEALTSGEALAVLTGGLDLMNGPLLRSRRGYEFWPNSEGVVAAMTSILQTYTARLIELAAEAKDAALIVTSTARAACVLDDPLAELPIRQIEQTVAQALGDDRLQRSVKAARIRLDEYLDGADPLADSA